MLARSAEVDTGHSQPGEIARMPKRLTTAQLLGEQGVALISRRFLEMGFPWHPTNAPLDAGIDGFIEIRDPVSGEASNSWLAVQSKARSHLPKETEHSFEFVCSAKDLTYWRCGNMLVLLVVSCPRRDEAWWVEVKSYFGDPSRAGSRAIRFDKKRDLLDDKAAPRLVTISQDAGTGTYFRPLSTAESLHSNLLAVSRMPARLFKAATTYRESSQVHKTLRDAVEYPPRGWFLGDGSVFSVHDLSKTPWMLICDPQSAEEFETCEWSSSEDVVDQRHFSWLLNDCLRDFLGSRGLRYHRAENVYYFKVNPPGFSGGRIT